MKEKQVGDCSGYPSRNFVTNAHLNGSCICTLEVDLGAKDATSRSFSESQVFGDTIVNRCNLFCNL